ncbi:hypothetical protein Tco_0821342 [Tanacetum coccineum]|uniref:Uncharacterized protein n=1 Tax=Tanacetum coccineum TaxID=301880 RepID=A0ABQ5ACZ5_9ASTR
MPTLHKRPRRKQDPIRRIYGRLIRRIQAMEIKYSGRYRQGSSIKKTPNYASSKGFDKLGREEFVNEFRNKIIPCKNRSRGFFFKPNSDEEDEEEEHLAPANSTDVASPVVDLVPFAEETEPFKTDESAATPPPPTYRTTSRMSIPPPPTSPTYAQAPLGYRATMMRATSPPTHHPLPLPAPSTSHRADITKADMLPQKRVILTAPTPRFEVKESSAAAAARQPGSTMVCRDDYSFLDTMDASIRDSETRTMAAIEVVNLRVSYHADVCRRESEIKVLRRERLAYEQESSETRQALARSEAHNKALEAQIEVLETQAYRHEWQRQDADDHATRHIMRTQALEAGARVDTLEDTGSSA